MRFAITVRMRSVHGPIMFPTVVAKAVFRLKRSPMVVRWLIHPGEIATHPFRLHATTVRRGLVHVPINSDRSKR